MALYFVYTIPQENGDHEVHKEGCSWMPLIENRLYHGNFNSCHEAVQEAKKHFSKSDGCHYCSPECDKR